MSMQGFLTMCKGMGRSDTVWSEETFFNKIAKFPQIKSEVKVDIHNEMLVKYQNSLHTHRKLFFELKTIDKGTLCGLHFFARQKETGEIKNDIFLKNYILHVIFQENQTCINNQVKNTILDRINFLSVG